jgi:hypothetical protein
MPNYAHMRLMQTLTLIIGLIEMLVGAYTPKIVALFDLVQVASFAYWLGLGIVLMGAFITLIGGYMSMGRRYW